MNCSTGGRFGRVLSIYLLPLVRFIRCQH